APPRREAYGASVVGEPLAKKMNLRPPPVLARHGHRDDAPAGPLGQVADLEHVRRALVDPVLEAPQRLQAEGLRRDRVVVVVEAEQQADSAQAGVRSQLAQERTLLVAHPL